MISPAVVCVKLVKELHRTSVVTVSLLLVSASKSYFVAVTLFDRKGNRPNPCLIAVQMEMCLRLNRMHSLSDRGQLCASD